MITFINIFCKVNNSEISAEDIDDFNKCKDMWNSMNIVIDKQRKYSDSSESSESE